MPTFPPVDAERLDEIERQLRQRLTAYQIHRKGSKITVLKGPREEDDGCRCMCACCFDVRYCFELIFGQNATTLEDETETCNQPVYRRDEIAKERAVATALIVQVITDQLESDRPPAPVNIGNVSATTFQISFTKDGPLGLSLKEEAGRMLVSSVFSGGFFEKFNSSHPHSQLMEGDYILEIQGETPSLEKIRKIEDGEKVVLLISTMQTKSPNQETMGNV